MANKGIVNLTPFDSERASEAGKKSKRGKSLKTILNELLQKEIRLPDGRDKRTQALKQLLIECGYTQERIQLSDLIVLGDMIDAIKGNDKSRERIWNYKEGKPKQPISGDDEMPINIKVVF